MQTLFYRQKDFFVPWKTMKIVFYILADGNEQKLPKRA